MKRLLLSFAGILLSCLPASEVHAQANKHAQHQTPTNNAIDSQQNKTKPYIIRVIDSDAKTPIPKAKITVELENETKTKWTGLTDPNGVFQFKWDAITPRLKAHTSVEAHGFTSVDNFQPLIEDRIIGLTKVSADRAGKGATR